MLKVKGFTLIEVVVIFDLQHILRFNKLFYLIYKAMEKLNEKMSCLRSSVCG